MAGHVARKGNRWYAVVYDGTDPHTGRQRRRWHPAGTHRQAAEASPTNWPPAPPSVGAPNVVRG